VGVSACVNLWVSSILANSRRGLTRRMLRMSRLQRQCDLSDFATLARKLFKERLDHRRHDFGELTRTAGAAHGGLIQDFQFSIRRVFFLGDDELQITSVLRDGLCLVSCYAVFWGVLSRGMEIRRVSCGRDVARGVRRRNPCLSIDGGRNDFLRRAADPVGKTNCGRCLIRRRFLDTVNSRERLRSWGGCS